VDGPVLEQLWSKLLVWERSLMRCYGDVAVLEQLWREKECR